MTDSYIKYYSNRLSTNSQNDTLEYKKSDYNEPAVVKKQMKNSSKMNQAGKIRRSRETRGEPNYMRNCKKLNKHSTDLATNQVRSYCHEDTKINYKST